VHAAPVVPGNGFLFATIRGELHEIHAAVSPSLSHAAVHLL
jgi:hypothetical protein